MHVLHASVRVWNVHNFIRCMDKCANGWPKSSSASTNQTSSQSFHRKKPHVIETNNKTWCRQDTWTFYHALTVVGDVTQSRFLQLTTGWLFSTSAIWIPAVQSKSTMSADCAPWNARSHIYSVCVTQKIVPPHKIIPEEVSIPRAWHFSDKMQLIETTP